MSWNMEKSVQILGKKGFFFNTKVIKHCNRLHTMENLHPWKYSKCILE